MNTDIRLSVGFWHHPKTKKTIKRLGLDGIRSLQVLWLWAAINRPDGNLSGMNWEDIELAADWQGEEHTFFALCAGEEGNPLWIDTAEENSFVLHDWAEHNPWQAEATARSQKAKKGAMARWSKQKQIQAERANEQESNKQSIPIQRLEGICASVQCSPDAQNTFAPCSPHAEAVHMQCKKDTQAYPMQTGSNAPFPSPSPKPQEKNTKNIHSAENKKYTCEQQRSGQVSSSSSSFVPEPFVSTPFSTEVAHGGGTEKASSYNSSPVNLPHGSLASLPHGSSIRLPKNALDSSLGNFSYKEPSIEFQKLRNFYNEHGRSEAPLAGFIEYKQLRGSKRFIGMSRIYKAIREQSNCEPEVWKKFAPSLARFLREEWWDKALTKSIASNEAFEKTPEQKAKERQEAEKILAVIKEKSRKENEHYIARSKKGAHISNI